MRDHHTRHCQAHNTATKMLISALRLDEQPFVTAGAHPDATVFRGPKRPFTIIIHHKALPGAQPTHSKTLPFSGSWQIMSTMSMALDAASALGATIWRDQGVSNYTLQIIAQGIHAEPVITGQGDIHARSKQEKKGFGGCALNLKVFKADMSYAQTLAGSL